MPPKQYKYGEDVIINGRNVGQARFDTATGRPLNQETVPASIGGFRVDATRTGVTQPQVQQQPIQQPQNTQENTSLSTPIGNVFNLPTLSGTSEQENALADLYRRQAAGQDIVDTAQIRSDTLAGFQDRINSLNQIYDQQLSRARQAGVGRVGQGTAVLAARGLAGSMRGGAVQEGILDQNQQIEETIQAERQAALAEVYGIANTAAINAAQQKREAILGGAKNYIEFLKGSDERKKTNLGSTVAALLTQGIDPSTMSPEELNSITSKIGASSNELLAAFKEGKVAKDATQSELARKIAKEEAELGKITTETQLMKDKFEDDKRRFGLEYAIKQSDLGIRQSELGLKRAELGIKQGEFDLKKSGQSGGTLKETGTEKNNLGFYLRGKDALDTAATLEDKITKKNLGQQFALEYFPNAIQSSDNQVYRQLQRQFTEARLRKESGAAIPDSEFESDAKTYFAQPGDGAEVLARKKAARDVVLQSIQIGAGNAYKNYTGADATGSGDTNTADLSNLTDEQLEAIANQ